MSNEVDKLFDLINQNRYSIREVSKLLDIPEQRMYSWQLKNDGIRKAAPKAADMEKIKNWLDGLSKAPVVTVDNRQEIDLMELKALTDAILDHYCNAIAQLLNRSNLDVQREILTKAIRNLKEAK